MNPPFDYSFYTSPDLYKSLIDKEKKNIGYFRRNILILLYYYIFIKK